MSDGNPAPGDPPAADDLDEETATAFIERFVDERGLNVLEAFVDPDQLAQVGSGLMPLSDAVTTLGEERALAIGRAASAEPEPPDGLPKYLREGVRRQDAATLRALAGWATEYADYVEAEADREVAPEAEQPPEEPPEEWQDRADEWEDQLDDAREDAGLEGGKGTLTTKTIDGRDYYYLQWREGDTVRSKYVAPVVPADGGDG